ncbi:hypothetical protein M426DRAFT_192970 [Hypoxylon sp. CI-4A]|nr:hypothetical protein M426DRAFT_192970 [Hypoxylon sp. CI-4A]
MPIHGPPVNNIIRTGPNAPGFVTVMRTPTEVARLEREVHTLRMNLLDRIRECPYVDCDRYFPLKNASELDKHLKEDHTILQCFLCTKKQTLLPYFNSDAIRQHFLGDHYDELKEFFTGKMDITPPSNRDKCCNRCGRDQSKLNDPSDQQHHDNNCRPVKRDAKILYYCQYCAQPGQTPWINCPCGRRTAGIVAKDGKYCRTCGLEFAQHMSPAYREKHIRFCKPPNGHPYENCPHCGVVLFDLEFTARQRHIFACSSSNGNGSAPKNPRVPKVPKFPEDYVNPGGPSNPPQPSKPKTVIFTSDDNAPSDTVLETLDLITREDPSSDETDVKLEVKPEDITPPKRKRSNRDDEDDEKPPLAKKAIVITDSEESSSVSSSSIAEDTPSGSSGAEEGVDERWQPRIPIDLRPDWRRVDRVVSQAFGDRAASGPPTSQPPSSSRPPRNFSEPPRY